MNLTTRQLNALLDSLGVAEEERVYFQRVIVVTIGTMDSEELTGNALDIFEDEDRQAIERLRRVLRGDCVHDPECPFRRAAAAAFAIMDDSPEQSEA